MLHWKVRFCFACHLHGSYRRLDGELLLGTTDPSSCCFMFLFFLYQITGLNFVKELFSELGEPDPPAQYLSLTLEYLGERCVSFKNLDYIYSIK